MKKYFIYQKLRTGVVLPVSMFDNKHLHFNDFEDAEKYCRENENCIFNPENVPYYFWSRSLSFFIQKRVENS